MSNTSEHMEQLPTGRLVWKMAAPAMIGVVAYNFYNLFDTLFLSRCAGIHAVGGVAVSFPLFLLLSAISSTLGTGAASVISRALGKQDIETAACAAANTFLAFYLIAICVTVLGLLFLKPILYAMGVTGTLLPYAERYTRIILLGAVTSTGFSNLIRAEGNSRYAMLIWVVPMAANVGLDFLLIFGLGMEVTGAALGTVGGQMISMAMSIYYFFLSGKSRLRFQKHHFRPEWSLLREILLTGIPSFLQLSGYSISAAVVNLLLRSNGGDLAIGTYGIVSQINVFFLFPIMGLVQGIQPVVGYNYGANRLKRVWETIRYSSVLAAGYGLLAYGMIFCFAAQIFRIFTEAEDVIMLGITVLKITNLGLICNALQNVQVASLQAVGKKELALFLALLNQILCFVPIAALLSRMLGQKGIWLAFPAAHIAAFFLSTVIAVRFFKCSQTDTGSP